MGQEGRLQRVEALIDLDRLDEARRLLVAILAGDPTAAAALRLLAVCDYRAGDGPAALAAADRAVAAEPEDEWGHRLRASALLLLGQPDAAMAAAREAVRLEPEGWAGHLLLGVAAASAGAYWRVGRAAFRRAARLAPAEAEVPFLRGRVLHALGASRQARRAYREAVRLDPQHAGALEGLAAIAMGSGRPGEALRYVRSAAAAAPHAVASVEYFDRVLTGSLGWAMMTTWVLMVVLLFTALPLAWVAGAGVVLAYVVWLSRMLRVLPPRLRGVAWARILSQPRQFARLVIAGASAAVALGVGIAASRLDPNRDPVPGLLPEAVAIAVAWVAGTVGVVAVDRRVASRAARRPTPPTTAMDIPLPGRAAARQLAFRCFTVALVPAIVLFVPAVDPGADPRFRAALGTFLLIGLTLSTGWIVRRQRPMSAGALARWSRVPDIALSAFWLGWLVLVAFLLGAAYLPAGSPLLVDVLAVGALVTIACGVLIVTAVAVVVALRRLWRRVRDPGDGDRC